MKLLVAGTARNIISSWSSTSKSLQIIFDAVDDYKCVIVESNSTDGTLEALRSWEAEDNRRQVIAVGDLQDPSRTGRIAFCRNKYMDVLQDYFGDFPHTLIVDLDESLAIEPEFKQQLNACFKRDDWDAVASNRRGKYYDIWALRCPALGVTYDCWQMAFKPQHKITSKLSFGSGPDPEKYVYSKQKVITGDQWIECQSAFGCMALYKSNSIKGRRYDGSTTCEHVSFHSGLKMFINPSFISG